MNLKIHCGFQQYRPFYVLSFKAIDVDISRSYGCFSVKTIESIITMQCKHTMYFVGVDTTKWFFLLITD